MLVDASTVVNAWRRVEDMTTSLPLIATDAEGCCVPVTGGVLTVEDAQQLARMFKALGDPTRVRLVSMIAAHSAAGAWGCDRSGPAGRYQNGRTHRLTS